MNAKYPTRIKSRQMCPVSWSSIASGVLSYNYTINTVDLTRAIVHITSVGTTINQGQIDYIKGAYLTSSTNLYLYAYTYYNPVPVTGATIVCQAEVIELYEAPKSIQNLAGNGGTTQTINTVDPNKVEIIMNSASAENMYAGYIIQINPTSIVWSYGFSGYSHYQVIEYY